jgi:hypothetical protein
MGLCFFFFLRWGKSSIGGDCRLKTANVKS